MPAPMSLQLLMKKPKARAPDANGIPPAPDSALSDLSGDALSNDMPAGDMVTKKDADDRLKSISSRLTELADENQLPELTELAGDIDAACRILYGRELGEKVAAADSSEKWMDDMSEDAAAA